MGLRSKLEGRLKAGAFSETVRNDCGNCLTSSSYDSISTASGMGSEKKIYPFGLVFEWKRKLCQAFDLRTIVAAKGEHINAKSCGSASKKPPFNTSENFAQLCASQTGVFASCLPEKWLNVPIGTETLPSLIDIFASKFDWSSTGILKVVLRNNSTDQNRSSVLT